MTEATNGENTLYGTQRMLNALNLLPGDSPEALLRKVKADIDRFAGETPQFDDITMLCLKRQSLPESESLTQELEEM